MAENAQGVEMKQVPREDRPPPSSFPEDQTSDPLPPVRGITRNLGSHANFRRQSMIERQRR